VITIQPVPPDWRGRDIQQLLRLSFGVSLETEDIVFSYGRRGEQQQLCFCCCRSEKDALLLLQQLQEFPVPNHPAYPDLFGCSFLYASRAALFVSHEDLDYLTVLRKFQVFTYGWQPDVTEGEFKGLLRQLKIFPAAIKRMQLKGWKETAFFLQFDRMRDVKLVMGLP
ncbi:hypothetical protein, conserved, partial [Eimeria maxima]